MELLLRFTLPIATPTLNEWQRMHFRERARTGQNLAWLIRSVVGPIPKHPIESCVIEIERHSSRLPDWDGLYGGLKPLLDAMVVCSKRNPHGLGIIRDDNPKVIERLTANPVLSREKKTVVRILSP